MAVSVETLKGLERRISITVPSEKIEKEVIARVQKYASRAKIDGFRPGKAPLNLIKQRYAGDFRIEVIRDLLQPTLFDALQSKELTPVGMPHIEPGPVEPNQDFDYTATFEVFPEFAITPIGDAALELVSAEVTDKDIEETLEKMRKQYIDWVEVDRKAKQGDKLVVDFEVFDGDKSLGDSGKARDFEMVLGDNQVIPALEAALVGAKKESTDDYNVEFPEDWHDKTYAGKTLTFKVTVKQVLEGKLPELDDAFAEKLNIKEGGIEALKKDIKGHMGRELLRRVNEMNRETIFDAFLGKNTFELPNALIDEEIKHLQHEFYHQIFGHEHQENEKIPDFPRDMFEERARRRVHLGLLFAEYVKQENISADKARVEAAIEKSAEAYDAPEEVRKWYHEDAKRMAELEALVIEEMASEKLIENAKITYKAMDYEAIMNPQPAVESEESEDKNEKKAAKAKDEKPKKKAASTSKAKAKSDDETGESA